MTIELDSTLAQAEVLFLSFAQLVADMDRRRAEAGSDSSNTLRHRRATSSGSKQPVENTPIPELSEDLRELLQAGR